MVGIWLGKRGRVKFEEKWVGLGWEKGGVLRVGKMGRVKDGEKGLGLRVR